MHFDGFHVSVYFAKFPAEYLHILRDIDLNVLQERENKIKLHHTKHYNLFNTIDHTDFIKEFVTLHYIAAGEANIGFLGKKCGEIHRTVNDQNELRPDEVLHPPQEEMDETEERIWRITHSEEYAI